MSRLLSTSASIKIGESRNHLTLIGHPFRATEPMGVFKCECGTITAAAIYHVNKGNTKSCGCARWKWSLHGHARKGNVHPLNALWRLMRQRCSNPNRDHYQRYGGRGIRVCSEWNQSFESFMDWALNNGWEPGLEIDRIDNDGNYEPENCRFTTRKQQSRNHSRNRIVEAFGESKILKEWSEDDRCQVTYDALFQRIKAGWNPEEAISTPKRGGAGWHHARGTA